jgi:hypothetical protein
MAHRVIGNRPALYRFRMEAIRLWVKWLGRRSQRRLTWRAAIPLLERLHLPEPPPWQAAVTERMSASEVPARPTGLLYPTGIDPEEEDAGACHLQ